MWSPWVRWARGSSRACAAPCSASPRAKACAPRHVIGSGLCSEAAQVLHAMQRLRESATGPCSTSFVTSVKCALRRECNQPCSAQCSRVAPLRSVAAISLQTRQVTKLSKFPTGASASIASSLWPKVGPLHVLTIDSQNYMRAASSLQQDKVHKQHKRKHYSKQASSRSLTTSGPHPSIMPKCGTSQFHRL